MDELEQTLDSATKTWERSKTEKGVPFYIDRSENKTHWDHPMIEQLFAEIDNLNKIRYVAYRTALKLRRVQFVTKLSTVHNNVLESALYEIGMGEDQDKTVATVAEVETLLSKMFSGASGSKTDQDNSKLAIELSLGWILKCYDAERSGSINVQSLKVGLTLLCSGTMDEKYSLLHSQVCDEDREFSREQLKMLMQDILLVPQNVGEGGPFSVSGAQAAAKNCWETLKKQPDMKISKEEFITWLDKEPLGMVWLPTLHRVATAETVKHEAKCACCKAYPIVGFRYRCLKCLNTDLCQLCFWSQKTTRTHKITHPSKEYCLATTTGDDLRDFAKQLKNKITKSYRRNRFKKSHLNYNVSDQADSDSNGTLSALNSVHDRMRSLSGRLNELEGDDVPEEERSVSQVPVPHPRRPRAKDSRMTELAEVEVHEPPPIPPPSYIHKAAMDQLERKNYVHTIAELRLEKRKLLEEMNAMKEQMPKEIEREMQADDEMALGLQEDNADQMFGGVTVPSVHSGSETDPVMPPSSTMNIPEIVESNELLKAEIEAATAHNQELESALAELRRKMKAIHASAMSSKPSSSSELMDRGTYTTLMEDWCYMTGNEEEKLKEFNDRMLSAFSEGIADDVSTSENGILQAANRVKAAVTDMVTEIASAQHPSLL